VHLQPAYQAGQVRAQALPATERAAREVLSLPMYPTLSAAQVDAVAAAVTVALS
jgi:dTDP-4-amino-4,6-dideoxygalactose transaminase